ncbi:MAG: transglycosylase domain-containing protein [Dehalococcoidia bacterium]
MAGSLALLALFVIYVRAAPLPSLESSMDPPGTVVLDANGTVLQRDAREGLRIPVDLEQVAPFAVEATIAAEDQRFGTHPGVDPLAIGRAITTVFSEPSGASTIQQQLARRLYLDEGQPLLIRKPREMLLALRIDARNSDDEILEAYLNAIYYGRGAYGIEAAARVFFGVSAGNLNLAQAAFLAGLPQLPSELDPTTDATAANERQQYVLDRMAADGHISPEMADAAAAEPLALLPNLAPTIAPHFVELALAELATLRPDLAGKPGLVIETTLDAALQQDSERIVRVHIDELERYQVTNGAVVVLEPGTGRILTMVGAADPSGEHGAINMALASRQPGSALKPFLYAAALERGYTAASPLLDVPTTFETKAGNYAPGNYDRRFHGVVTLRTALASSYNVPAVRTLADIGLPAFLDMAHRVGLQTLTDTERYGLSLTLGGGEVRLLDVATAYGTLANGGLRVEPYAIERVRDTTGRVLYERPAARPRRALDEAHAWILTDILRDPAARTPGFGERSPIESAVGAAVKTGTTTGFRDNWTAGYTPERVVAAWVGNADNRPMDGISGVAGAGPIWRDVIELAAEGTRLAWPAPPETLVRASVCEPTGLLPGPDCPGASDEWFVRGTEPREAERYYVRGADGALRIDPPAEARPWALDAGFLLEGGHPGADGGFAIVQPARDSVLFVAPELADQQVMLRASVPAGATSVEFRINGELAGVTTGDAGTLVWRLEPGRHEVEAVALLANGERLTATSRYEVRER